MNLINMVSINAVSINKVLINEDLTKVGQVIKVRDNTVPMIIGININYRRRNNI